MSTVLLPATASDQAPLGERGNRGYLPPDYAKEIAGWLTAQGAKPFVLIQRYSIPAAGTPQRIP